MVRGLITVLLALCLEPRVALCQTSQPPNPETKTPHATTLPVETHAAAAASNPSPLAPAPYTIRGRALEIEGGMLADATIWVTRFAEPGRRIVETTTDSRGNYSIVIPDAEKDADLVLRGATPSGLEACELLKFISVTDDSPLRLRLRKPAENYDEPSLDALDTWLAGRIRLLFASDQASELAGRSLDFMLKKKRRQPAPWDRVVEILGVLNRADTPEARLFAAAALMRVSAWQSAGEILAEVTDDRVEHEKMVLEGVRLNFLRRPREAEKVLQRTLLDGSHDEYVNLELGRAAMMEEDWARGLQKLDTALKKKHLAAYAHYLRAKCLYALGDIDSAAQEAKLLTRRVKKKRLPAQVRAFVDDLQGRLKEGSIQAIRSVMTQPFSEIQKAVPSLARLDTSRIPEKPGLQIILKKVGVNIERFFREFANTSALEVIRQSRA